MAIRYKRSFFLYGKWLSRASKPPSLLLNSFVHVTHVVVEIWNLYYSHSSYFFLNLNFTEVIYDGPNKSTDVELWYLDFPIYDDFFLKNIKLRCTILGK